MNGSRRPNGVSIELPSDSIELPASLFGKIVDILTSIPQIEHTTGQQAFITQAGVDRELRSQILFGVPATQFTTALVSRLLDYGTLMDGRNALEALLESAKALVGQEMQMQIDSAIDEIQRYRQAYRSVPREDNLVEPVKEEVVLTETTEGEEEPTEPAEEITELPGQIKEGIEPIESTEEETGSTEPTEGPRKLTMSPLKVVTRALSDKASKIDFLGFTVYAQALADFIKHQNTEKPLSIGIDASWGRGKTTLMQLIKAQLDSSTITVWFNAWKYDKEEALWAALALEILNQVRKKSNMLKRLRLWLNLNQKRFDWNKLLQKVFISLGFGFLIGVLSILVFSIAMLQFGGLTISVIKDLIRDFGSIGALIAVVYATTKEAYTKMVKPFDLKIDQYIREPVYGEKIGFFAEFERDFKFVVESITAEGKRPLVIFIDDLDRCAPEKSVEILEAINILLDTEYCVFILAMDTHLISASIAIKYKELQGYLNALDINNTTDDDFGRYFLEKIIQINFRIPEFDEKIMYSFVEANLEGTSSTPSEQRDRRASQKPVQEEISQQQEELIRTFDTSEEVKKAIQEAIPYLNFNPRRIKRFINTFRLQAFIANRRNLFENGLLRLDVLAKWLIIATCWPILVDMLAEDNKFLANLLIVHEALEQLKEKGATAEEIQAELDAYHDNPQVKRFIESTGLIYLLKDIGESDLNALRHYLHLAQIGTKIAQGGSTE